LTLAPEAKASEAAVWLNSCGTRPSSPTSAAARSNQRRSPVQHPQHRPLWRGEHQVVGRLAGKLHRKVVAQEARNRHRPRLVRPRRPEVHGAVDVDDGLDADPVRSRCTSPRDRSVRAGPCKGGSPGPLRKRRGSAFEPAGIMGSRCHQCRRRPCRNPTRTGSRRDRRTTKDNRSTSQAKEVMTRA
jgi:hypothetical protein